MTGCEITHMLGKCCRLTKSRRLHKSGFASLVVLSLAVKLIWFNPVMADNHDTAASECVVLLHGLWRTGWSMKRVEWVLEDQGYSVVNVSYPSVSHSIEELGKFVVLVLAEVVVQRELSCIIEILAHLEVGIECDCVVALAACPVYFFH